MSNNYYKIENPAVYSVDVDICTGIAYFTIKQGNYMKNFEINLIKEGYWIGAKAYRRPHPQRHFICPDDGDLVITPYPNPRLILLESTEKGTKIFVRARQWELDYWFSKNFPDSTNAKIYNIIKNQ